MSSITTVDLKFRVNGLDIPLELRLLENGEVDHILASRSPDALCAGCGRTEPEDGSATEEGYLDSYPLPTIRDGQLTYLCGGCRRPDDIWLDVRASSWGSPTEDIGARIRELRAMGKSMGKIAAELHVSKSTVHKHLSAI